MWTRAVRMALWAAIVVAATLPVALFAQGAGMVVDQTGLPVPGATVQLLDGATVVSSIVSGADGSFEFAANLRGSVLVVVLPGFETATVPRADGVRVVLEVARATETSDVVAPGLTGGSPTAPLLGGTLTAANIARLPSTRLKARESLPLLPSVVRGADGLMQLGGARPHETPLLIDGFDVTDPATGTSSINLPFEAVRGIEFLRDPMAVTYGGLLGGVVQIETKPGSDKRTFGVQGIIPRPRLQSPGFGRLEGIFPRVYSSGALAGGRAHYFSAVEYDFERITVPDVTQGSGPNIVEKSASIFARVDVRLSERGNLTAEAFSFPSSTDSSGLSPRREEAAAADVSAHDLFGGVTGRFFQSSDSVFTVRVGLLSHRAQMSPLGIGAARLSPVGWRDNWFTSMDRRAIRYSAAASWERTLATAHGAHDITVAGGAELRRLTGTVAESSVAVEDEAGRTIRTVTFGDPASLSAHDRPLGLAVRDVVTINDRLQIDGGARFDNVYRTRIVPSARAGVRMALDSAGTTVLKAGIGHFVSRLPLAVEAFAQFPRRLERRFDSNGQKTAEIAMEPGIGMLRQPRATAVSLQIERQLRPGLDIQAGVTNRQSSSLATLDVPSVSGPLMVRSEGTSTYRELQVSVRQTWPHDQQLFLSYVRSSSQGELNDYSSTFQNFDVPLVQPGGRARLSTDTPHRVLAWGTFNLPGRVVLSPVVEWRSGFPYSTLTMQQLYAGVPNGENYPAFLGVDMVTYRKFTAKGRHADLGIQLFNLVNHFNPRDVYAVTGAQRFGTFTNSVGPVLRGFMMIDW